MRRRGFNDPGRRSNAGAADASGPAGRKAKALTVSELTLRVKELIEYSFQSVCVEGEISNFKRYGSGHCYFTLKDSGAQLSGVIWRSVAERLRFEPEDGQKVYAQGRLSLYEVRGQYQLVVTRLEPVGVGALAAAFEALKAKLASEGLFDSEHKRELPLYPRRIALVTSGTGAAIQDMKKVIYGRWPNIELIVAPVRVQGDMASGEIVRAIQRLNALKCADVMIVGRGGGSLEDLWAFNEEQAARAIFASEIPIISAVGHEVDFTIADFVADVRAATPSHAGELVVTEWDALQEHIHLLTRSLPLALENRVQLARERVNALAGSWAFRSPEERIQTHLQHLDDIQVRMELYLEKALARAREGLSGAAGRLENLSPLKVLARGYSVATRESDGKIVRAIQDLAIGERLITRLADGHVQSVVESNENLGETRKN